MDRGISDVLGYVLVFSLILGTIGIVYAGGYGSLAHVRDVERVNNAERAFDVLDTNVDDLVIRRAPSRATEIKLADSSLGPGDPVVFNVSFDGTTDYETRVDPIVFRSGENDRLTYENGAVIRGNGSDSVMVEEPSFVVGDRTLIPLIETRARGSTVGGSGRVHVRTVVSQRSVENYTAAGTYDFTINVTTQNTGAWHSYLEEQTDGPCTVTGNTVSCSDSAEKVYLQVTAVDVYIR